MYLWASKRRQTIQGAAVEQKTHELIFFKCNSKDWLPHVSHILLNSIIPFHFIPDQFGLSSCFLVSYPSLI